VRTLSLCHLTTPDDYEVVVKRRDPGSKPWRWEIYVAGKTRHVERSENSYAAMAEAMRDGKEALKRLLARESERGRLNGRP
jgi:hypothetical protein